MSFFKSINRHSLKLLGIAALAVVFSSQVTAATKAELLFAEKNNLTEVRYKPFDKVFQSANVNFTQYKKVYIEDATASFSRYWISEHRRDVTRNYKEKTLQRYAKMLTSTLTEELAKVSNFVLVDSAENADLIIKPSLENLNIFAPDDSFNKSLVFRAGVAELNIIMIDAKTQTVVANIIDSHQTRETTASQPQRATRLTNTHDFKRLMQRWSKNIAKYLQA